MLSCKHMTSTTVSDRTVEQLPDLDDLADAVLSLRDRDEVRRFLRDLCTLPELEALTPRSPPAPARAVARLPDRHALAHALLSLRDRDGVRRFLRALCTLPELEALTHRWQTVRLLEEGVPYVEIAGRVPTSTATVTRVAQW